MTPHDHEYNPRKNLDKPCSWKKPRRIFVKSDLFHKDEPDEFIDEVMLTMAVKAPRHIYQVLTKRPDRAARYFSELPGRADGRNTPTILCLSKDGRYGYAPPKNIWIGTSAENQQWYDERVPHLLLVPAAVRFLSLEPLLGEIDLRSSWAVGGQICHRCGQFSWYSMDGNYCPHCGRPGWSTHTKIHWAICGGESGPGARPMRIDWVRSIVGQCKEAQTAVFVKQLGASPLYFEGKYLTTWRTKDKKGGTMEEWPTDLQVRQFPQVKAGQMELLP